MAGRNCSREMTFFFHQSYLRGIKFAGIATRKLWYRNVSLRLGTNSASLARKPESPMYFLPPALCLLPYCIQGGRVRCRTLKARMGLQDTDANSHAPVVSFTNQDTNRRYLPGGTAVRKDSCSRSRQDEVHWPCVLFEVGSVREILSN